MRTLRCNAADVRRVMSVIGSVGADKKFSVVEEGVLYAVLAAFH